MNPFVVSPQSFVPLMPRVPAPVGLRIAAMAIDLFAFLFCIVPVFIFVMIQASFDDVVRPETDPAPVPADAFAESVVNAWPVLLLGILVVVLVQVGLLASRSRSLGKQLLGLSIVTRDGKPAGFFRLVCVRTPVQVLSFVPFFMPVLLLINLVLALRPPGHAIHDRVAGTEVVLVPPAFKLGQPS